VLPLQHPVLVLVFKQSQFCSLSRWLGQEMIFVNCCLPYFRQWLINHLLSAGCFCRLYLLKVHVQRCPCTCLWGNGLSAVYFSRFSLLKVCVDSSSLFLPLFWCTESTPPSLLHVLFSSLFIIQFFLFCGAGVSLSMGLCWFVPGSTACWLFVHLVVSQAG
jgi:hypothetical protein